MHNLISMQPFPLIALIHFLFQSTYLVLQVVHYIGKTIYIPHELLGNLANNSLCMPQFNNIFGIHLVGVENWDYHLPG